MPYVVGPGLVSFCLTTDGALKHRGLLTFAIQTRISHFEDIFLLEALWAASTILKERIS
jgi:hypothetical protein